MHEGAALHAASQSHGMLGLIAHGMNERNTLQHALWLFEVGGVALLALVTERSTEFQPCRNDFLW